MTMRTSDGKPAPAGVEPKVVIRPAGAAPTGVRTSPTLAAQQALLPAVRPAAGKGPAKASAKKGKAKAKARKPATPRVPLTERLRARARNFRFRLLPLTIFVAVMMLGVRVGDLWRLATHDARLPDFPVTFAQGPQSSTPATPPAQMPSATTKPAGKDAPPAPGGSSGPADAPAANAPLAPLGPIDNQELLQHFAERRAEIERRTKEMEQREALLAAAEKRIDQKVAEMEKTKSDIQKLMAQGDQQQSAQLDSLVKIYETMKPKDAARIFEELDMPVLLGVIQKMKEQKTAPILAAMDPVKAKEVTSALVERRVPLSATVTAPK
ncbi:MotE family protein [Azospirillum sp. B2RO_4]|uniref:MotE family protein n=1 Tax=Azospirillum sp. B2RO_4 TaxID=3027796 RepID=UPI003DA90D8B